MGNSVTLLRRKDVLRIIGVDAATLWRWRKAGCFPSPVKVTKQTLRWQEADIVNWLESRRVMEGGVQ